MWLICRGGLYISIFVNLVVKISDEFGVYLNLNLISRFLGDVFFAGLGLIVGSIIFQNKIDGDLLKLIKNLFDRLPKSIKFLFLLIFSKGAKN